MRWVFTKPRLRKKRICYGELQQAILPAARARGVLRQCASVHYVAALMHDVPCDSLASAAHMLMDSQPGNCMMQSLLQPCQCWCLTLPDVVAISGTSRRANAMPSSVLAQLLSQACCQPVLYLTAGVLPYHVCAQCCLHIAPHQRESVN